MKRQRGIADAWLIAIAVVVAIVIGLAWYAAGELVQHGRDLQDAVWQKRENQQLVDVQAKYVELNDRHRALERSWAQHFADVSAEYEKEKADDLAKTNRVIADVRAGARKLLVPVTFCNEARRGLVPSAAASAGQRDGGASAELSGPAAEFLIGLAGEADAIVRQLSSCQALLKKERGG